MRRTIASLMFLAMGGLVSVAPAAEPSHGDSSDSYYASGAASFSISDDDAGEATATAGLAPAKGQATSRPEKTALYVDHGGGGYDHKQVGYSAGGGGSCDCSPSCNGGCSNSCNGGCGSGCCTTNWACGNDCDCAVNTFRFEFLAWFTRGRNSPPLVTTGTPASLGFLGDPDTQILFDGQDIGDNIRSGGRLTFSHLFNDGCTHGDVRFWGLEDGSEGFSRSSNGDPLLAIPFVNALSGLNDSIVLALPGVSTNGSVNILAKNDLIAADAWLRRTWYDDCCDRVDLLAGYMFTRLDDSLSINAQTTFVAGPPAGTVLSISDSFRTQNEFHGAQLGFLAEGYRGNWSVELLGKIAIGDMRQQVAISGSRTTSQVGGPATTTAGGLFAQPTNIGEFDRHRVAFAPEVNLNLIYNVNSCWRVMGGYSFVYWSNVVLAGNQIDPTVNLTQAGGAIQGPAFPRTTFARTDFWAQGASLGAEYRW